MGLGTTLASLVTSKKHYKYTNFQYYIEGTHLYADKHSGPSDAQHKSARAET